MAEDLNMNRCEIVSCIDANLLLVSLGCVSLSIVAHASGGLLAGFSDVR